jgi:hypothetical protein
MKLFTLLSLEGNSLVRIHESDLLEALPFLFLGAFSSVPSCEDAINQSWIPR